MEVTFVPFRKSVRSGFVVLVLFLSSFVSALLS